MSAASLTDTHAGKWLAALYDFSIHGGAVGDIPLRVRVPKGAIVVASFAKVLTAPTGASATIGVKLEGAGDIFAVAAISGAPWSSTGIKLGLARYTATIALGSGDGSDESVTEAGAFVTTTVERELTLSVGTAVLTAGKINIFIQYVVNATA